MLFLLINIKVKRLIIFKLMFYFKEQKYYISKELFFSVPPAEQFQ